MFLQVSPVDRAPITLNFRKVECFYFNENERLTEIRMDGSCQANDGQRYLVKESVNEIQNLLEHSCNYEAATLSADSLPDETHKINIANLGDIFESSSWLDDEDDLDDLLNENLACISFDDYTMEIHRNRLEGTIRPYLHTPSEQRYLTSPISCTKENIAELMAELSDIMVSNIMNLPQFASQPKPPKKKNSTPKNRGPMKLLRFDKEGEA